MTTVIRQAEARPLGERLGHFTRRQAEILERTAPLYRMFRTVRHGGRRGSSPAVTQMLEGVDQIRRRYLAFVFERELEGRPAEDRDELMEALVVSSSWNAWEGLRLGQSLDRERAQAVMARVLTNLLG